MLGLVEDHFDRRDPGVQSMTAAVLHSQDTGISATV